MNRVKKSSQNQKKSFNFSSSFLRNTFFDRHCGKLGPYSTGAIWQAASSGLEGFGKNFRLYYRIKEGGHLPYEGLTEPGLLCLNLDT